MIETAELVFHMIATVCMSLALLAVAGLCVVIAKEAFRGR